MGPAFPGGRVISLTDAEAGKDLAQQVVAGGFAGNLAQRAMCETKFFRRQFVRLARFEALARGLRMSPRTAERIDVAAAGREGASVPGVIARRMLEMGAQRVKTGAALRGDSNR